MDPAITLLILRILSAFLLLLFFGVIGWLVYRDVKLQTTTHDRKAEVLGEIRIVSSDNTNKNTQTAFPLYSETWIGRASANAVVLDDAFASNEHAVIRKRGGQWWLEDLESRNGTLLNDVPLSAPAVITEGDVFTVGRTSLEIGLDISE